MIDHFHTFLRSRRSIRRFEPRPVPDEMLQRILETATFAPSAHNDQPWRFAVLNNLERKTHLAAAMTADFRRDLERDGLNETKINNRIERSRRRIVDAPVVIVLCMDSTGMDNYPDSVRQQAETTMAVQSTALAGMQLLLAAHAEGLGGVWTCGPLFTPETVRAELDLPAAWQPQAMLFIGYPMEPPQLKNVKPLNEIARFIP